MMINWEHAPKWAMAIAMDVDSTWHYFDKKPYPNRRTGRWDCQGEFRKQAYIDAKQIKLGLQWEQTLQCRPGKCVCVDAFA